MVDEVDGVVVEGVGLGPRCGRRDDEVDEDDDEEDEGRVVDGVLTRPAGVLEMVETEAYDFEDFDVDAGAVAAVAVTGFDPFIPAPAIDSLFFFA